MRFGIVTPVFDPCINSLELLYKDLELQTHEDWVWIVCGNKFSKLMDEFVESKRRLPKENRLKYLYINDEDQTNFYSLIANVCKRRDYCIKRIEADYLFMIDADAKILDKDMFKKINFELSRNKKDLCIYKITHEEVGVLPVFPITHCRIDTLNFCVKASIAKKVGYPTKVNFQIPPNDWRFFGRIYDACNGDYLLLDNLFCQHNGNNRYKNAIKLIHSQDKKNRRAQELEYVSYCLNRNYPLGLFNLVKELLVELNILSRGKIERTKLYP
jgi:hypothetical protein